MDGDNMGLASIVLHEMAHTLGLLANVGKSDEQGLLAFPEYIPVYTSHLYDALGNRARPGMPIYLVQDLPSGEETTSGFYLQGSSDNPYPLYTGLHFRGKNVTEVLEGARLAFPESAFSLASDAFRGTVDGVPINGFENGNPEFGHIELQNSLMSHQEWRNWGVFMEAELAILQDIGYRLDRKRFFGRSIYGSGTEDDLNRVRNDTPFYERENGTWLEGVASTTPWGIGLHVYGSWNDVTQAADILTVGRLATGVRLEGVGNRLTVESGVRVQADGNGGTGLLVSYGRNHEVNVKGTVTALGPDGIAARFDFGDNTLGNRDSYRGSYMWTVNGETQYSSYMDKIYGSLVDVFNVSGTLLGAKASVYIDESAHVREINILSGAWLAGDIVSNWNPSDKRITAPEDTDLHTNLTFGLAPTVDGGAGAPDPGFFLAYGGDIKGAQSFNMTLSAGTLALAGNVHVLSLATEDNSTLALLKPDVSQVTVENSFTMGNNATLATAFAGDGSGARILANSAHIGTNPAWTLVASPDWYANGTLFVASPLTTQDATASSFTPSSVRLFSASPTLSFQLLKTEEAQGGLHATLAVSRASDAYARYAASSGDAEIGHALQVISRRARGDMQNLLSSMDWSGRDGSNVRTGLSRLSPETYDAVARASLDEQSSFSRILLGHMLSDFASRMAGALLRSDREGDRTQLSTVTSDASEAGHWKVWAAPYGSGSFQGAHGSSSAWSSTGVGLVVGADHSFDSGLVLGGHVALAAKRVHVEDRAEGRADTKSAYAGLQAFFAPESWDGFWLSAQGRLGIESGEMDREVRVGAYARTAEGNWSGFAGAALLGGGKDFATTLGDGALVAGPLAWFEYAFLNRPSFGESGGGAANLDVDAALYESFLMNLGAHAAFRTELENGTILGVDLLAAWRHELSPGRFATTATFSDYGDHSFTSDSGLPGRDSLLARSGFTLASGHGFSARLEAGVELFREDFTAVDVGLRFAWEF